MLGLEEEQPLQGTRVTRQLGTLPKAGAGIASKASSSEAVIMKLTHCLHSIVLQPGIRDAHRDSLAKPDSDWPVR